MRLVPNKFPLVETVRRLAIIGEAPGAEEERLGTPFVGASGHLLDSILRRTNLLRVSAFVGNVYQYRPPNNDITAVENTPQFVECLDRLKKDLAIYQPHLIIALGNTALKALTGRDGINKWRGSVLPCLFGPYKVIATFHPAAILRDYKLLPIALFDFRRAVSELQTDGIEVPKRVFHLMPSFTQALSFLSEAQKAERVAIDFETLQDQGLPVCIGIAVSEAEAMCIPLLPRFWSPEEHKAILDSLHDLFRSPTKKVFHNSLFDCLVAAHWLRILPDQVYMDTMIAHHACYPELPKSLAFCASIYTKQPYYKEMHHADPDEKRWKDPYGPSLWAYNCTDACVTLEVSKKLEKELEETKATKGYQLDMRALDLSLYMTLKGIRLDKARALERYNEISSEIEACNRLLAEIFGREINVKSPKQLKELLYDELGLPPILKDGKPTVDANALIKLAAMGNPHIKIILKTVQLRTKLAFFSLDSLNPRNDRIHASFRVAGTETGRWSGSESILGGRSVMNIPEDCRDVYVPDPGKIFVGWDKAQAEARVVAYKAAVETGDESYLNLVKSGVKVHRWFGAYLCSRGVFKKSPEEVVSGTPEYFIAKVGVHAFSYGMGPRKFCDVVEKETDGEVSIPERMAKNIKEALYEALPAIPKWQEAVRQHLQNFRYIENPFGRVRVFFERWGEALFGEAYAYEPQSTVADDTCRSILACFDQIEELEILQQNYDSMLAQCDEAKAPEVIEKMKPLVMQPIQIYSFDKKRFIDLIIPVVFKKGFNWKSMEELP
ncbi:MAG: DNA polymerase [Candidatus Caldarchaeum sp.]